MMRLTITGNKQGEVTLEFNGPVEIVDLRGKTDHRPLEILSSREKEVIHYLIDGYTYNQIAEALFVSPHTVKNHIQAIYRKFQVNSKHALLRSFYNRHIL